MHSDRLIDHFRNPRNVGELPAPAITVEVSNPICGDILRLSVRFDGNSAAQACFKARGCTASIAAGSALTELIAGKSKVELAEIDANSIEAALGGLSPESAHAAVLCAEGVRKILKID